MKSIRKTICTGLAALMGFLPVHVVRADMIGTDRIVAKTGAQENRQRLLEFAGRPEIIAQMEARGVPPAFAVQRTAAMTDEEINALAAGVDSLPAGGVPFALVVMVFGFLMYWAYAGPAGSK